MSFEIDGARARMRTEYAHVIGITGVGSKFGSVEFSVTCTSLFGCGACVFGLVNAFSKTSDLEFLKSMWTVLGAVLRKSHQGVPHRFHFFT